MRLIYDGTAFDTKHIPGEPARGRDGKAIKRQWSTPHKFVKEPIEVYDLWGLKCPKGEEVEVPAELVARGIAKKAKALKCFRVLEVPVEIKVLDEPTPETDVEPKRRGRPRKAAEAAEA